MPSVLIAAFGGLQPAQVTSRLMPNLAALATKGVAGTLGHLSRSTRPLDSLGIGPRRDDSAN